MATRAPIVAVKPKLTWSEFQTLQNNLVEMRRAYDAFSNPAARLGWGTSNLLEKTEYPLTRLSFNYILLQSLYRSNWVARKVVDVVAEDLTKNWVRLDTELTPEQTKSFDRTIDDTGTKNQLLTTIKWARLFGGAGAVMIIDGHKDLEKPLDLDDVEPNSYKGLIPLDRWSGIYPSGELCGDINRPLDFGLPEFYRVQPENGQSFTIHSTRVLRFIGRDLPVWEKQVEQYWGTSVIETMYDELKKFDNTSWNIASLIFRANIMAIKQKNLNQMISGLGSSTEAQQNFYAILSAQSALMSNQGLMVLPEDGGMETHQYSFAGMRDMYESFKENICGASDGIPYSRMFGRPPGGLSTTNEGDENAYYENIATRQNRDLDPQMKKLMPVVAMSSWGKVPDDFHWVYKPVRVMTEEARTALAKDKTTAIVETYNSAIISPRTALLELKQQSEETGMWTNITDDDIANASEEPMNPMGDLSSEAALTQLSGEVEKDKASHAAEIAPEPDVAPGKPKSKAKDADTISERDMVASLMERRSFGEEARGNNWVDYSRGDTRYGKYQKVSWDKIPDSARGRWLRVYFDGDDIGKVERWYDGTKTVGSGMEEVQRHASMAGDSRATDENIYTDRSTIFSGFPVRIENEVGSVRRGKGWEVIMKHPYGYIDDTLGRDGDKVDVFLGPDQTADYVYVVHTAGGDKEDKVMLGFNSAREAQKAFLDNYNDAKFFGSMDKLTLGKFAQQLKTRRGKMLS